MRILHTMDTGGLYGKERLVLNLIKEQFEAGHQVDVAGFGDRTFYNYAVDAGAGRIFRFDDWSGMIAVIGDNQYDIIHTHDYKTGIIAAANNLRGQNTIVRTLHGFTGFGANWNSRIKWYEAIDKAMLRFNSANVAVSDQLAKEVKGTTDTIYNGISPVKLDDTPELNESIVRFCTNDFTFMCMARLSPEKNLFNLFEAVMDTEYARLVLFGDGPLKQELAEFVHNHDRRKEKIFIAGFDPNCRYYLKYADAYIQPSLTEGMPISVLEAMSLGVPLITSDVGGMKVLHEEKASAHSSTTPKAMATAMHIFIQERDLRKVYAEKATALFHDRFSIDAMFTQYDNLYNRLIQEAL